MDNREYEQKFIVLNDVPLPIVVFKSAKVVFTNTAFNKHFEIKDIPIPEVLSHVLGVELKDMYKTLEKQEVLIHKTLSINMIKKTNKEKETIFVMHNLDNESVKRKMKELELLNTPIPLLAFYHGVKVETKSPIIQNEKDEVIFKVPGRQMINKHDNKEFFFKLGEKVISGQCFKFDMNNKKIYLNKITQLNSHSPFNREERRFKPEEVTRIKLGKLEKPLQIYDLSEKSLSLFYKSDISYIFEGKGANKATLNIPFIELDLECEFLKKVEFKEGFKFIFELKDKNNEKVVKWLDEIEEKIHQGFEKLDQWSDNL